MNIVASLVVIVYIQLRISLFQDVTAQHRIRTTTVRTQSPSIAVSVAVMLSALFGTTLPGTMLDARTPTICVFVVQSRLEFLGNVVRINGVTF
jgi:hypothetical protein